MSFSWQIPERRNPQGVLLPAIPAEVYLHIFEDMHQGHESDEAAYSVEYRRNLSNIALSCRYFCSLMVPRLFSKIVFTPGVAGSVAPNHTSFCNAVTKNKGQGRALAQHIKHCEFVSWGPGASWVTESFLKIYIAAVQYMTNLETLELVSTPIYPKLLSHMGSLPALNFLAVNGCSFEGCNSGDFQHLTGLKLRKLEFQSDVLLDGNSEQEELMGHLINSIDCSGLLEISTDHAGLLARLHENLQGAPLPLRKLTVDCMIEDFRFSTDLFSRLPHLQALSIGPFNWKACNDLELQADHIPQLTSIACESRCLRYFVPGRPLSSVRILSFGAHHKSAPFESIFKTLAESSTPVRQLRIPLCKPTVWTTKIPTSVHKLHIDSSDPFDKLGTTTYLRLDETSISCLADWFEDFPKVLILEIDPGDLDGTKYRSVTVNLKAQHEGVLALADKSPRMEKVMVDGIEWTRVEPGKWEVGMNDARLRKSLAWLRKAKTDEDIERIDFSGYWHRALAAAA
ncbi:hypothetical protein BKA70DRAFT_1225741 [Coprinopsis sp. MPI-PUGE-AT-0042]|nr:hypothetical protein BKA70DRAFT_1225741 [Coprinopsis sp. MPI-PUGE-AT-0042]